MAGEGRRNVDGRIALTELTLDLYVEHMTNSTGGMRLFLVISRNFDYQTSTLGVNWYRQF